MKLLTIIILFAAMNACVVFLAGLNNVPRLVRISVAAIAASFGLTTLLVWKWQVHSDYGIASLGLSIAVAAVTGFRFTHRSELTRDEKLKLIREYALGIAITSVAAVLATALILQLNEPVTAAATTPTDAPTSSTVTIADSTKEAIKKFNEHAK